MTTKVCAKCKQEKDLSEFHNSKRGKLKVSSICKVCDRARGKLYYKTHKESTAARHIRYRAENRKAENARARNYRRDVEWKKRRKELDHAKRIENPYKFWARDTINGHRIKKEHEINLSEEYLETLLRKTTKCPICDVDLVLGIGTGMHSSASPSLDRIDNTDILNQGNTWIICRKCNVMKQNVPMEDYIKYCKRIVDRFSDENGNMINVRLKEEWLESDKKDVM